MSFPKIAHDLHDKIQGVNRYNPENVDSLTKCIDVMVAENGYDKDICLTMLKLFQLNPDKFNENTVKNVLMKTLMVLPSSDFALAKCLIDSSKVANLKLIIDLGGVLEACDFNTFWKLMKGNYKPSIDPNEPFKIPQEVPRLIKSFNGFEEAVRNYICRVISATFQRAEKAVVSRMLGGATDALLEEYAKKHDWSKDTNSPDLYFINNHEESIQSRNIEEKLQFQDVIPVLQNLPRPLFCTSTPSQ